MERKRLTEHFDRIRQAASGGQRREISDDFKYDKRKLKHLKHILHNVSVALGTLISALNEFSRVKGPDISPDGMIGGLGYIMPVKDVKEVLNRAVKDLSDVSDSIADELSNPKWDAGDDKEVKKLIKEKEEIEEKVEDVEEDQEPEILPEDVVTSKDVTASENGISKKAETALTKSVRQALLRFNSLGK